jgi:hypothetical protein
MAPGILCDSLFSSWHDTLTQSSQKEKQTPIQGWPTGITGDQVWDASQFISEDEYTYTFTIEDEGEIRQALDHFKSTKLWASYH